ncbi:hypothetical protein GQ600_24807 [Phytophthora cactorum]|nr:hypothetical protein GQ600_24807 [Phytophthora cactorum]
MVARVLAAYNVHGEEAFAVPWMPTTVGGRKLPRVYTEIINDRNISRKPTTSKIIRGAYVEQQPPSEIAPAPTMEELQDLAGEVTDKVHCSNITGEMDTSAQFEEFVIALYEYNARGYSLSVLYSIVKVGLLGPACGLLSPFSWVAWSDRGRVSRHPPDGAGGVLREESSSSSESVPPPPKKQKVATTNKYILKLRWLGL